MASETFLICSYLEKVGKNEIISDLGTVPVRLYEEKTKIYG
jgi:hypothetical protein